MSTQPKILIVDDKPQNLVTLERTLQKLNVDIFKAMSGDEALGLALEHEFAMAIVDVQMPEMDGYELVELLRGNPASASLPIIFVSAIYSDEYHHRKGYDSGAVDFMSKPYVPEILLSKVRVFLDLYEKNRQLQSLLEELNLANAALSRRTQQLETSLKIGQQITSILNQQDLLREIVNLIQMEFHYLWVGVWLASADNQSLVFQAGPKTHIEPGLKISVDHRGLVGRAYRSGNNALENKNVQNSGFTPTPGLPTVASQLSLPLRFARETVGVLDIQSDRPMAFHPDDMAALELLTTQIALAVRNARLYGDAPKTE